MNIGEEREVIEVLPADLPVEVPAEPELEPELEPARPSS